MKPSTSLFNMFPFKSNFVYSLLLMVSVFGLSGCNVDPSFGYAFAGTGAVMAAALVIATAVTRRADKRKRKED